CFEKDVDNKGIDIENYSNIKSPWRCQALCQSIPECQYFTYLPKNFRDMAFRKMCFLKTTRTTVGPNFVRPTGRLLYDCFEKDIGYPSNDLGLISNVTTVRECQDICQDTTRCEFFAYVPEQIPRHVAQHNCYLKSNKTIVVFKPGLLSGPKFC
ncbi:hypothetical protein TCAL_15992, partial [Tigriopus californicus]